MISNNCNMWVTSALSASPLCENLGVHLKQTEGKQWKKSTSNRRQDLYAFAFLSWSTVRTITTAAFQICQNIFTATLNIWLKLHTSKKFHFQKVSLILEGHTTCTDPWRAVMDAGEDWLTRYTPDAPNTQPVSPIYMWTLSLLKLLFRKETCTCRKENFRCFYAGKIPPQVVLTQLEFANACISFVNGISIYYGHLRLQNPVTSKFINNIHFNWRKTVP